MYNVLRGSWRKGHLHACANIRKLGANSQFFLMFPVEISLRKLINTEPIQNRNKETTHNEVEQVYWAQFSALVIVAPYLEPILLQHDRFESD